MERGAHYPRWSKHEGPTHAYGQYLPMPRPVIVDPGPIVGFVQGQPSISRALPAMLGAPSRPATMLASSTLEKVSHQ